MSDNKVRGTGYDYKYMFLSKTDRNLNKKISARELDLVDYVVKYYKNELGINLNPKYLNYYPNSVIYLFNATFSNKDLLEKVAELYASKHPRFKNQYDFIAMTAEGHNAERYGFLKWSDSKKTEEYTKERLIPILYSSDFHNIKSKVSVTDLFNPDTLVYRILSDRSNSITEDNRVYVKQIMKICHNILSIKYDSNFPNLSNAELYFVDKEYDKSRVSTLLDSVPIKDKYEVRETLYYNLLSVIMEVERTYRIAKRFNVSYEPYNGRLDSERISNQTLAYLSILSEDEYVSIINTQEKEKYKKIEKEVIDEYNRANGTTFTSEEADLIPEIFMEINRRLGIFNNGKQRN